MSTGTQKPGRNLTRREVLGVLWGVSLAGLFGQAPAEAKR